MTSAVAQIVDYGLGNLFNVQRACSHVGLASEISSDPERVLSADALILPGVGAMRAAMATLEQRGLDQALREAAARGTTVFGVCLGMQLLMEKGIEFGEHSGLGLIPGQVVRFPNCTEQGEKLRVPHIGWNAISPPTVERWRGSLFEDITSGALMYFVHSYHAVPDRPDDVLAVSCYEGLSFCSAVVRDNVIGCQFHPERSGNAGLKVYGTFARLIRK